MEFLHQRLMAYIVLLENTKCLFNWQDTRMLVFTQWCQQSKLTEFWASDNLKEMMSLCRLNLHFFKEQDEVYFPSSKGQLYFFFYGVLSKASIFIPLCVAGFFLFKLGCSVQKGISPLHDMICRHYFSTYHLSFDFN